MRELKVPAILRKQLFEVSSASLRRRKPYFGICISKVPHYRNLLLLNDRAWGLLGILPEDI